MTNFFKKVGNFGNKMFKKVSSGANALFKKDGILEKGMNTVAGGLGKVADYAGKGINLASQVALAAEGSPFAAALAPMTGFMRKGINIANRAQNVAQTGSASVAGTLGDVKRGASVGQITSNVLEKANAIKDAAQNKPQFV